MDEQCRERILSEDYVDFIWKSGFDLETLQEQYPGICIQQISTFFTVFYVNSKDLGAAPEQEFGYEILPGLYTLLENESLEASQILQIQNQPVLRLRGNGVILGFVDTGIDYTNSCFRDLSGRSRILEIWDQTIQTGNPPEGLNYGSVYTNEDINRALSEEIPERIVPSVDEIGHGTELAAIAGGSMDETRGWIGAAPEAELAMVKLKPAKNYLREYFMVPPDALAYQENDIMLGVRYLLELSERERKPLVICMALGNNMGGHSGTGPLATYLNSVSVRDGRCVVTAGGNEANQGHHYYGTLPPGQTFEDVELRVADDEYGLMMELWSSTPDVFSLALFSPTGEEIPRIAAKEGVQRFEFLFEETTVYITFQALDPYSGDQLIVIRMRSPSAGIWRLRVIGNRNINGIYNIWLPVSGFIDSGTVFLRPNPDITLTEPSNAELPITVGAYQSRNHSIYIDSSRGFTRRERIKPDLTAPGVQVSTFAPGNRFTFATGTSAAAAVTAGAAALLLEWGIVRGERPGMDTTGIKQLLIRGADRTSSLAYPDRSWGWGTLNLYAAFQALGRF